MCSAFRVKKLILSYDIVKEKKKHLNCKPFINLFTGVDMS